MASGRVDCVRVLSLPSAPSGSDWFAVGLASKRSAGAPFSLEGAGGRPLGYASTVSLLPSAMLVAVSSACGSVAAAVDAALFKSGGDSESAAACARAVDVLDACLTDSMAPDAADEDPLEAGLATLEALSRLARSGVTCWLQAGTSLPRHSVLRGEADRLKRTTGWSDPGFALVAVGRALALVTMGLEQASASESSAVHAAAAVVASLAQAVKLRSAHDDLYHLLDCWSGTVGVLFARHHARAASPPSPPASALHAASASSETEAGLGFASLFSLLAPAAGRCGTMACLRRSSGTAAVAAAAARSRALSAAAEAAEAEGEVNDADFEVAGAAHPGEMLAWLLGCGFAPGSVTSGIVDSEGASGGTGAALFDTEAAKGSGGDGGWEDDAQGQGDSDDGGGGGGAGGGGASAARPAEWGAAWADGEPALAPERCEGAGPGGAASSRFGSARFGGTDDAGDHDEDEDEDEEEDEEEEGRRAGGAAMEGLDEETLAALGMAAMAGDADAAALLEALGQDFDLSGGEAGVSELLSAMGDGAGGMMGGGPYGDADDFGADGEDEEDLHAASAALGIPPQLLAMLSQAGPEEAAMLMSELGLDPADLEAVFSHAEREAAPRARARAAGGRQRGPGKNPKSGRRRRR